MPWRRSATRTLWVGSYTFAKIERPSLVSPTLVPRAEALKAVWEAVVASKVASVVLQEVLLGAVAGRSTSPTFVPHTFLLKDAGRFANRGI